MFEFYAHVLTTYILLFTICLAACLLLSMGCCSSFETNCFLSYCLFHPLYTVCYPRTLNKVIAFSQLVTFPVSFSTLLLQLQILYIKNLFMFNP